MSTFSIPCGVHQLELGPQTRIMGIVNVTPDSFSDGGHFYCRDKAVAHALQLVEEGADILDIGGESTRPYSDPVTESEELDRVLPVIEALAKHIKIPISIDTTKASVARQAVASGASLINDISGLRMDPAMAGTAAQCGVPLIIMHMKGTPKNMQVNPVYENLIDEIMIFFSNTIKQATDAGVNRSAIILDPGIGFGKTIAHNLKLTKKLKEFHKLGLPILFASSRKAFIRQLVKKTSDRDIDPLSPEVVWGTQATVAAAAMQGAHIVRVHDVACTRATLAVVNAIQNA